MMLTAAERQRFAEWCEREAETDQQLVDQLEKGLPGVQLSVEALVRHKRFEMTALTIVARILRSIEDS